MAAGHREAANDEANQALSEPARQPSQIIAFRDFERLLTAFGFVHERTTGSHRHYVHPQIPWVLTVQPEGKDAKRYQIRRLLDIIAEYELSIEE